MRVQELSFAPFSIRVFGLWTSRARLLGVFRTVFGQRGLEFTSRKLLLVRMYIYLVFICFLWISFSRTLVWLAKLHILTRVRNRNPLISFHRHRRRNPIWNCLSSYGNYISIRSSCANISCLLVCVCSKLGGGFLQSDERTFACTIPATPRHTSHSAPSLLVSQPPPLPLKSTLDLDGARPQRMCFTVGDCVCVCLCFCMCEVSDLLCASLSSNECVPN